ncbi:MAG: hypothetical protein KF774_06770 [Planctomyces sp.]|nr:hypothetical protein [Planctomyces sp.]
MIALTVDTPPPPSDAPEMPQPPVRPRGEPDLSVLEDRVPDSARFSRRTALLTLALGMLFAVLSYCPLWHTDLWGHLSYGRWIADHQSLPETEPFLPLAEGVRVVDTAWLSQLAGYLAVRSMGAPALQFLYAAAITLTAALLALLVIGRTSSLAWGLAAVGIFLFVDYQQLIAIRPQLAGLACFAATFAILNARRWQPFYWVLLPSIFALWANLHGSFAVGLALMACFTTGRAIDIARRLKSSGPVLRDPVVRRRVLLLELCAAAVLLNPYGLELYLETFRLAGNENVRSLIEWEPLTLRMMQGRTAAAALLGLLVVLRLSPRRVSASEALSLALFGFGACWTSRIILWWGVIVAYVLAVHGAAIARRWRTAEPAPSPRSGLWTVATLGLAWIAFSYTPFGVRALHGPARDAHEADRRFRRAVSAMTPVDVARYLHDHPPQGQVFNTVEWGDYLLWAGPKDAQWFTTSHVHLIPAEVWQDYLRIAAAGFEWDRKLDRYGVNTVVADHAGRADLIRMLRGTPGWTLEYEDAIAAVFTRDRPL